ncbi:MAG TPA: DnaJ family domain-containing protein [Ktedonobacterales bacterium]|jgi:DnaJ family protein C protein 28|nr:DnaJ family domain-containing protein [Ktedonobacterales bacterium]
MEDSASQTQPPKDDERQAAERRPSSRGAQHAWEMEQARRRAVRDIVEQRIQEAREEGKFDNLRGAGKPLRLDDDIWAGDKALAYHLLKSNDVSPQELERGREVDMELTRAEEPVRALRHYRDTLRSRRYVFASDRRAYNLQHAATERRYAEALRAINSKILSLNIIAPPALHRRLIDVELRLAAFRDEFPPMDEA